MRLWDAGELERYYADLPARARECREKATRYGWKVPTWAVASEVERVVREWRASTARIAG